MGQDEDIVFQFLSQNDVFADVFNGYLFSGKPIIQPQNLESRKETLKTIIKDTTNEFKIINRNRDLVRSVRIGEKRYLLMICGIEHQQNINYSMPFRTMMYDCLEYAEQISVIQKKHKKQKDLQSAEFIAGFGKDDFLTPVITIVFYTGKEKWSVGTSLFDMFPKEFADSPFKEMFGNWPMNLFDINEDINTDNFSSDLKLVLEILKYKQDKDKLRTYLSNNSSFEDLDITTYLMISKILDIDSNMIPVQKVENEKGGINVCQALLDIKQEGIDEGISQGIDQGISQGINQGIAKAISGMIKILKSQGFVDEQIKTLIMNQFHLTEDAMEEYF